MSFTTHTQTIEMELKINSANEYIKFPEIKTLILHTQNLWAKACNKAVLEYYLWEVKKREHFSETGELLKDKDVLGKTIDAYVYDKIKEMLPYIHTSNISALNQRQSGTLKTKPNKKSPSKLDNILRNEEQLSTFKNTIPIDIHNNCWSIQKELAENGNPTGKYILTLNLFNTNAEKYFENLVKEYEEKVLSGNKDKNKQKYNEKQLEIYKNILKHIQQKNNNIIFTIVNPQGSVKATLEDMLNYEELTKDLVDKKNKLKAQRNVFSNQDDYKEMLGKINAEIEKCLEAPNTSKRGTGQLYFKKKDKKIYFSASHTFMSDNKKINLNPHKILGVDLGITNIATMQIYNTQTGEYEKLSKKKYEISGNELIAYRQKLFNKGLSQKQIEELIFKENLKRESQMFIRKDACQISGAIFSKIRDKLENRKRELSIATKWASKSRRGHGIKTRRQSVAKMENKFGNFKETYNHKISRYIVEFAKKNQCYKIVMEDLSKFTKKHQQEKLLRNWTYYDLQTKIKYKAEKEGIEVQFVNPRYTSKRCSNCGCIDDRNRDCKNNQALFKCVNEKCGYTENADVNAARNLALPNIEKIITETLNKNKTNIIEDEDELFDCV